MIRRLLGIAAVLLVVLAAAGVAALLLRFDHAPLPDEAALLNPDRLPTATGWDVMGRAIGADEAGALLATAEGRRLLSPEEGAIRVDADLARVGREAFYRETYGNEVFLSDVLGLLDGGLSVARVAQAIGDLGGRGTSNLRVRLARDVQVGGRLHRAGDMVATGLDVPEGEMVPLGIRVFYDRGTVRVGVTCALCHATVDPASGKVVEGAPNRDLAVGLLLALSANPAAFYIHAGVPTLAPYRTNPARFVRTSDGGTEVLPEPDRLAGDVRAMLAAWPPGSFDSSPDLVNNPTSIPTSFTAEAHPYGWSGHAGIGPFRGLSALNTHLHGLNSDTTAQAAAAPALFGIDPELYLGTLLQSAPGRGFAFDPASGRKPSEVLASSDPTPGRPGVNGHAVLPNFPRANYVTANGLVASRAGEPVGHAANAMSPFQNGLRPPDAAPPARAVLARGRDVFDRAGCLACHSGPALTSHRVWPAGVIGTEPTRARAFARTEATIARPQLFATDTPFPEPPNAFIVDVPVADEGQLKLAWGHNGTGGGYKVASLVGLAWSAPYLHDGGVAVGPDPERRAGTGATLAAGIEPDPANSLRALLDRSWRERVVLANRDDPAARLAHVTGEGHAFWVDPGTGFDAADRDALVAYLLSIDRPQPLPPR